MPYLFGLLCVCALGVMPLVGCSEGGGAGGSGGSAGTGGTGGTGGTDAFACTEQGIRDAIAEGGGPHFFDCDGPTTVVTAAEIIIDNNVILDGEGNLTVDGDEDHRVFSVSEGVTAALRGFSVTNGFNMGVGEFSLEGDGGGIYNDGTLTLTNSTVSGNWADYGGGIYNDGALMLTSSTVSDNPARDGGGIYNDGTLTLTNSTVSGNLAACAPGCPGDGGGIYNDGTLTLTNSTVSGNGASQGGGIYNFEGTLTLTNSTVSGNTWGSGIANNSGTLTLTSSTVSGNSSVGITNYENGTLTLTNTLVDNECYGAINVSGGGNLESPGDTCGFDQATDQVEVTVEQLNLGPLWDNGGPTRTHALLPGSVAIDKIPAADCVDADGQPLTSDQRGEPRPAGDGCDVGAFEVQP